MDQPTGASWWEYTCTLVSSCGAASCDANWSPSYETDHFYWDGSSAVRYGSWFTEGQPGLYSFCDWWRDATGQWYGPYDRLFPGECWAV